MQGNGFTSSLDVFDGSKRLYRIEAQGELEGLLVEAWSLREGLSEPWTLHISALSPRSDLRIRSMIGNRLTLHTALSDGSIITTANSTKGIQ